MEFVVCGVWCGACSAPRTSPPKRATVRRWAIPTFLPRGVVPPPTQATLFWGNPHVLIRFSCSKPVGTWGLRAGAFEHQGNPPRPRGRRLRSGDQGEWGGGSQRGESTGFVEKQQFLIINSNFGYASGHQSVWGSGASARRLGRHHFGVGTWGLRRRSLRKPRESPRPRGRRLIASRTRTWGFGGHNSPNALALMRFEDQIP